MNARNWLFCAGGAVMAIALMSGSAVGQQRSTKGSQSSPGMRANNSDERAVILSCAKATVSALNFAAEHGFRYVLTLPSPPSNRNWHVESPQTDFPDDVVIKQITEGCRFFLTDEAFQQGVTSLLDGLINDSKLGIQPKLTGAGNKTFQIASTTEESSQSGQAGPSPLTTPAGQSNTAPAVAPAMLPNPATPVGLFGQQSAAAPSNLTGQLQQELRQVQTRLDKLNDSVLSSLNQPSPSHPNTLPSILQLALVGLTVVASTVALAGVRRLGSTMPEPQLLKNLRDEILRSRQRGSEAEALAGETQRELSRIDAALRALRSEIGSLRSAPAPEQERLPRPSVPQPAPKASEPMPPAPANSGSRVIRAPSNNEWCAAYNDALGKQNLDGFRSRFGGIWARIQDRTTRPATLVPVDHPPERGILDGFLYVPNGHSSHGWVFPGPNFYAARSAISTGQMMLEAFGGIFEAQPGEVYALRQPAIAVEGRTGLRIENPGLIVL
jgi:hypothetical protein